MAAVFLAALLSCMAAAWFGETASMQEKVELEFRATFILFINYLLYGTLFGQTLDFGLLKVYESLQGLILINPPLNYGPIYYTVRYLVMILEPVYVTAVIATGIYLLFVSGSPSGRTRAKSLLPRLVLSMVAVTLSLNILQIIFSFSYEVSKSIIVNSGVNTAEIFTQTLDDLVRLFTSSTLATFDGGYLFIMLILLLVGGMFTVLTLRYVILLFFTLAFPLGIFLYTFGISRGVGRVILEQTILWTLIQIVVTIIIVIVNIGVDMFGIAGDLRTLMGITAFIAVIISPIVLISMVKRFLP